MCDYVFKSGKKCDVIPKEGNNYCWKHRDAQAKKLKRREDADTFAKSEKKDVGKKIKSSVFLITINSQKDYQKMSAAQRDRFKKMTNYLFTENNIMKFLLDKNSPDDNEKNLESIEMKHNLEIGEIAGRYHLHALVNVTHTSMYTVELAKLKMFLEKSLGYRPFVNVTVSSDPSKAMEQYINKINKN